MWPHCFCNVLILRNNATVEAERGLCVNVDRSLQDLQPKIETMSVCIYGHRAINATCSNKHPAAFQSTSPQLFVQIMHSLVSELKDTLNDEFVRLTFAARWRSARNRKQRLLAIWVALNCLPSQEHVNLAPLIASMDYSNHEILEMSQRIADMDLDVTDEKMDAYSETLVQIVHHLHGTVDPGMENFIQQFQAHIALWEHPNHKRHDWIEIASQRVSLHDVTAEGFVSKVLQRCDSVAQSSEAPLTLIQLINTRRDFIDAAESESADPDILELHVLRVLPVIRDVVVVLDKLPQSEIYSRGAWISLGMTKTEIDWLEFMMELSSAVRIAPLHAIAMLEGRDANVLKTCLVVATEFMATTLIFNTIASNTSLQHVLNEWKHEILTKDI